MKGITKTILTVFITITVVVGFAYLVGNDQIIEVDGDSSFEVKPDLVTIYFEVRTNSTVANDATQENAIIINNIFREFELYGLDGDKIVTTDYRMNPIYKWDHNYYESNEENGSII